MGRGRIVLTFEALKEMLNLPDDAEIYGVEMAAGDLEVSQFSVYVKHKDLPEWREGARLLKVVPNIETTHAPAPVIKRTFKGWQ